MAGNPSRNAAYGAGSDLGVALAKIYLDYLRGHDPDDFGGMLQQILFDMFGVRDLPSQRRGEIVGFAVALERVLRAVAKEGIISSGDPETWLDEANRALAGEITGQEGERR